MQVIELKKIERTYKNNGQHAEQVARYTLTGEIVKADNKPFWTGADCMDIQIKSAKATVANGTDLQAHMAMDAAERYGYVIKDFSKMYIMDAAEWTEFCGEFAKPNKKDGKEILRLTDETMLMKLWLYGKAK